MARDRKRAKQRQQQRRSTVPATPRARGGADRDEPAQHLTRADLPGALEHAGDVDEFDAALVRGADGVQVPAEAEESLAEEIERFTEPAEVAEPVEPASESGNGVAARAPAVRPTARPAEHERQSLPARAVAFLRASWAELQRVQWPDRPQVTQATAVVIGFVAVAGIYFGVADYVAKEIVETIL